MISKNFPRRFCSEPIENIENYHLAVWDTQPWDCHHRREIDDDGTRHSKAELVAKGLYWNRPASELIFLQHGRHTRLHWTGKRHTREARERISIAKQGSMFNRKDESLQVRMVRMTDGMRMTFPSMQEATRWLRSNGFPKASHSSVSHCCHGKIKSAYGATWQIIE